MQCKYFLSATLLFLSILSVSYSVTNVISTSTNGTTSQPTTKKANLTVPEVVQSIKTRRKNDGGRSTSSDTDDKDDYKEVKEKDEKEDLDLSTSVDTSNENKYQPKESGERKGWRRWHRKCTPCPEFDLKWKHQSINWICGAYQRARRSFKSLCMMHYRNCQDGTMFIKIHDDRCKNNLYHGEHFFYDYKVELTDEDSLDSGSDSSGESTEDSFPTFKDSDEREINKLIESNGW